MGFSEKSAANIFGVSFNFCTELYDFPSNNMPFYQAIVCGLSPSKNQFPEFLNLGLWHLLIVSTGHWLALAWIFKKLLRCPERSTTPRWLALLILVLLAGVNIPLLRSWLAWRLDKVQVLQGWRLLPLEVNFLSALICAGLLFLLPNSSPGMSYSLLASWWLANALSLSPSTNYILKSLFLQLFILPLLLGFQQDFLPSLLGNLIFGPLLAFLLYPLALLFPLFPELIDPLVSLLLKGILFANQLLLPLKSHGPGPEISENTLWLIFLAGNLISHLFLLYQVRSKLCL